MAKARTELQEEVVEALVSTKAINFDAVGTILSKFGARAAVTGDQLGVLVNRHVIDICIPPEPYALLEDLARGQAVAGRQGELR